MKWREALMALAGESEKVGPSNSSAFSVLTAATGTVVGVAMAIALTTGGDAPAPTSLATTATTSGTTSIEPVDVTTALLQFDPAAGYSAMGEPEFDPASGYHVS